MIHWHATSPGLSAFARERGLARHASSLAKHSRAEPSRHPKGR
ncbi:hypothetical protein HMPREF0762_00355 [Slackia exigua ATCC 700122]|uniref:Uncharacterized protein n=1 Tax=Slackia exigua (strain ATCC 700122 / DSM 15923 / CIP 105133 / JCM 11022 / KCTC 5966 / S-7) TaxID=649764 RepID=D0WEW8_SLAES|nr:hypothetical protein HMPREF0762_00355 [Slackia exigua ATCC 700122]